MYTNGQHVIVLNHIEYVEYGVSHGCGMQFERFYSLNNSVVGSFSHLHHLGFQQNLGKPLWW